MTETGPLSEIKLESLSGLFPHQDIENLEKLSLFFEELSRKKNLGVSLLIVGGSLTKPFPRKDIDIVVYFEKSQDFPRRESFSTHYDYSKTVFARFKGLVDGLKKENRGVKIEYREPLVDEEFSDPNMLRHDGSIIVKFEVGTLIELLPSMQGQSVMENPIDARPFAVLLKQNAK